MKANLRQIRKQLVYSEEFKRELVSDFESGKYSVIELEKLHRVTGTVTYDLPQAVHR
ncbi:MAG: hypothetical protein WBG90_14985 [Saonia sp.]